MIRSANAIQTSDTTMRVVSIPATQTRLLWVVIVSVAIIAPVYFYGVPSNKDLFNHFRLALPFYDSLRSGHLYPGWLAESNSGYGDPSFRFYPPALFYLLSLARSVAGSWYAGTVGTLFLLSVLSGLGMYFWARAIVPGAESVCAAVVYAIAPYHVNQLYQAFMLPEFAGAAVLPFAFGFVERVCKRGRNSDVAGLAAAYALLTLTHLPLAVIGSLALASYGLVRIERQRWLATLAKLGIAAGLGLAASAVYWMKMVTELKWVGLNNVTHDSSVDYYRNFVFSTLSPDNLNVWWMNILVVMTFLLLIPAVIFLRRSSRSDPRFAQLKPVTILALLSLFMALPLSFPLWKILPLLQETQFPWRWLSVFSMSAALLTGAAIPLWLRNPAPSPPPLRLIIFGCLLVSVAFTMAHSVREAEYRNREQFESDLQSVRGTRSVNYWLPVWASASPRQMPSAVECADRPVSIIDWGPEHRSFEVAAGPPTEARVRTFFYPHWRATSQGSQLPIRPDRDGALLISLPGNGAIVDLDFREPPRIRIAAVLTALGWLSIGLLASPLFGARPKKSALLWTGEKV